MEKKLPGQSQNLPEQEEKSEKPLVPDNIMEAIIARMKLENQKEVDSLKAELETLKSQKQQPNQIQELLAGLNITSPDHKHQSHGMTVKQMQVLREKQANGIAIDTITANKDSNFKINEHEKRLIHVLLEQEEWDRGVKKSKPRIQKFYPNDFNLMQKNILLEGDKNRPQNAFAMYDTVKIIHDPRTNAEVKANEVKTKKVANSGNGGQTISELRETYRTVVGDEPDPNDTIAQLNVLISEAMNKA